MSPSSDDLTFDPLPRNCEGINLLS